MPGGGSTRHAGGAGEGARGGRAGARPRGLHGGAGLAGEVTLNSVIPLQDKQ